jgi:hypothetical protein
MKIKKLTEIIWLIMLYFREKHANSGLKTICYGSRTHIPATFELLSPIKTETRRNLKLQIYYFA